MLNNTTTATSNSTKRGSLAKAAKLEEEKTKKIDNTMTARTKRKNYTKKDAPSTFNHLNVYHKASLYYQDGKDVQIKRDAR
jgi:hypothetical protein